MAETWTPVGKVTPTPKGAWSSSTTYARLDIVSNDGSSYIAIQGVPAGTAITNTTYWQKFADKGDTGATGATGNGIASIVVTETSVSGAEHNYRMAITMTSGSVTNVDYTVTDGAVTSVNGETGAITGVAMDDGYYENMTVGSADQLISSVNIEDKVPYVFRTSGGANDIGDREVDEIVGGTIAWNQLVAGNDIRETRTVGGAVTFTKDSTNGTITLSGTATTSVNAGEWTAKTLISEHKYLYTVINADGTLGWKISNKGTGEVTQGNCVIVSGNTYDITFYPQMYDITQMFGSAIADYIYSLEQANAGAGVAWFKSLFPKPFYAFNSGELISVSGLSAHKMTGFNAWDEEWELGAINPSTGANENGAGIRTKNYIPVVPNQTYFAHVGEEETLNLKTRWYDANKSYLGSSPAIQYNHTFTVPSNACYLRFCPQDSYGTVYKNDICINLAWDGERNGEFEPYVVHEYALDSDVTLRGIPKLDADNKLYYDGDTYASDGSVQRRWAVATFNGATAEPWSTRTITAGTLFEIVISDMSAPQTNAPNSMISGEFAYNLQLTNDKEYRCLNNYLSVHYDGVNTVDAFKTWLSTHPISVVYPLATPTTESADPYTTIQRVSNWGTEEYVIAEQNGVALPVGHLTRYTQDLKAKLEMAPQSPSAGNGDYVVRQTNGINTYVPLTERIPNAPSENGNYILKCTVSGSTVTYTWEAQS